MSRPIVIKPRNALLDINVKEVWEYRGLISLFTKRNIKTVYAQTVLGPLWLVVSPIISALVSAFVFGNIAKISSDGVPYFLFFMCSNAIWSFFAGIITQTSNTFISNARLFSKSYFPRLVSPISTILTGFVSFSVQIIIFILFVVYFSVKGFSVKVNAYILLLPLLVLMVCLLGLGIGLIMASVTAKYRDLSVLFSYGISLFMYLPTTGKRTGLFLPQN